MNYFITVLSKYAVFSGRARRSEYWYFFLFSTIISVILMVVGKALNFELLNPLYSFAILLPSVGVSVRRMHDIGKSGWYILIPIYNLILACTAGTQGPNEYGEDPKGGTSFGEEDYERPLDVNPEV